MNSRNIIKNIKWKSFITSRMESTSSCQGSSLIIDKIGAVTSIGINRPQKRNCVDSATAQQLKDAIASFENDETSHVGVLYGIGGNFCAGYDLSELASADTVIQNSNNILSDTGTMGPTHRFIKKPLIAAISGYAVAGGLELSLMCDMRVVEETAIMGVYCRRFGIPLIDGGTVRLAAMIGLSRALDLILTGRSLEAKEAFEWGLANRIVACGTSLGQAINVASSLTKYPQACLLADRESTYNAAYCSTYDKLLKYERGNAYHVIATESVQGAKKFVSGIGRHGKSYNLTERDLPAWEADYDKSTLPKNKL